MTPSGVCAAHSRIALDSSMFIYVFEANPTHGPASRAMLWAAEAAGTRLITSAIAVGETAVRPARDDEAMADRYGEAIRSIPRLDIVPVSAATAVEAAILRGRHGIGLLDAIHLATARQAGATALITNDRRLPSLPQVEVILLDDLEVEAPAAT